MKNIIDILKGLGIEVPENKTSDLNKEVAENYKTVAEFDKKVSKMQGEIDKATEKAKSAEETLRGFEGKDFDEITKERDKWKTDYENLVQKQKDEQEQAELDEAITNAIKEAKGRNANAIIANLDMEKIKASKNRDKDIADAIKALSEAEDTAFLFETDPENNRAQFTDRMKKPSGAKDTKYTMSELMKMKNENPDLDITQYM